MSLGTLAMLVLLAHRLMSGYWKEYRLLTLMVAVNLLSSAPPLISYATEGALWALPNAKLAYWVLTLSFQTLVFSVILQLLWRVGKAVPSRAPLVRILSGVAALAGASVVFLHSGHKLNMFMGLASRDLTFVAALFTMALWTFLLQVRKRDRTLLLVCLGIGIQSAGDAFAHSIRLLGKDYTKVGNVFFMLVSVMSVFLLLKAFEKPYRAVDRHKAGDTPNPQVETLQGEQASIH